MSKRVNIQCFVCGKTTTCQKAQINKYNTCGDKACLKQAFTLSAKDLAKKQYNEYVERWKAGSENGMRGTTSLSCHIRKYLFEKYSCACRKCGWSKTHPTTGKVPLEVNHIDGNHLNNNETNLELLCPNCHSLTPTYRSLNKGHGRPRGDANRLATKPVLKTDLL